MGIVFDLERLRFDTNGVEGFFYPLARHEQETMRDVTLRSLVTVIRGAVARGDEDAVILTCCYHWLLGEAMAAYRAQAVTRRASEAGQEIVWPGSFYLYPAIAAGRTPENIGRFSTVLKRGPSTHPAWRRSAVRLRREVLWNGVDPRLLLPRTRRQIQAIHRTGVMEEHARRGSDPVRLSLFEDWFRPAPGNPRGKPVSEAIVADVVDAVANGWAAGNEVLPDHLSAYFAEFLRTLTVLVRHHYSGLQALAHKLPERLWTGTGGNVYVRMLRHAVQGNGGHVTGFEHGAGEAHLRYFNAKPVIEYVACDEFVTTTKIGAQALGRSFDASMSISGAPPALSGVWGLPGTPPSPTPVRSADSIRTIMYPTTALLGERITLDHFVGDYVLIDAQIRIMSMLGELGYQVIHKPHVEGAFQSPERLAELPHVTQVRDRFESVIDRADLFLVDFSRTSILPPILASDKPVVLIYFGYEEWDPHAWELLQRRCAVVRGGFDADNRLRVDVEDLRNGIATALERTDRSIVAEFFPHLLS